MTTDLLTRARAGDGEAFRALTEPYRRELQVHCYRMLGSLQDAEDALQDALLAAWQGLAGFEGRASIRAWLYRIATNRCLNARRSASRRPAREWDMPEVEPPEPTRLGELGWLEPYPDALLSVRRAYESGDLDALVALLTDDIHVSMPPIPSNTRAATSWPASSPASSARAGGSTSCRRAPMVSRRSGAYLRASTGIRHGTGLFVLTLTGDRICAFTRFDSSVLPWFGLPRSLPSR
jgi:RNA polymerase sigma factor (sigma-70 family)